MRKSLLLTLFIIISFWANAQQQLISINDPADAQSAFSIEELVEEVLVAGGCSGVGNFSSQVSGAPTDLDTKSYGYFSNGTAIGFPFKEGIVLTTGFASQGGNIYVPDPQPNQIPDNNNNTPGDADIENSLGITNTSDATFVKFNFVPTSDVINFRFIMASEEYNNKTECEFSDAFAFLLREVGTVNYTNIAVLPNGDPVSLKTINNVTFPNPRVPCPPSNANFFAGYDIKQTNYDGRTTIINATSPVVSGRTYEIKLVVADQNDSNLDSAIFLEAGSFDVGIAFEMEPTCGGGTATVTGDTGGTFAFNPVPTDGAILDAATGTITNGVAGTTYTVEYTTTGTCTGPPLKADVTVLGSGNASFTMTPTCDGGTATITGDAGGTFVFNPVPTDGAIIDATTGTVTNGTDGATYTINYTTSGTCSSTATDTVTVTSTGDASFAVAPSCEGGLVTITGDTGGTFTFDPLPTDGAIIDATTGEVTSGIKGTTYTVKYSTPGACGTFTTQNMTLLSGSSSFTLAPTCDGAIATITGDLGGFFVFFPDLNDGAIIDRDTGTVTNAVFGTTYTVEYNTGSDCEPMTSRSFTPTASTGDASFTMTPTCDGGTANITGDAGGEFSFNPVPNDGAVIDKVTGTITNGISGTTYFVDYTISGACSSASSQTVTVLPSETILITAVAACDGGTLTITGTAGGVFELDPLPNDGAIINATTGTITNGSPGATYSIKYKTSGSCSNEANTTVTVLPEGNPSFTITANCDGAIANVTGDQGGVFRFNPNPNDGASIDPASGAIANGVSGTTYSVEYTITAPCIASSTQNVTITLPPSVIDPLALISCDEDGPGELAFFDLESKNDEISGGNSNYKVTYHDTQADADNNSNALASPYFSISRTVYVRVQEITPICFSTTTLDLQVEILPIATPEPYRICDDNMELDGNSGNDSVLFDLDSQTAIVLNGLDPTNYTVGYYTGRDDAEAGINELTSPYENTTNPQTLIVRVDNNITSCFATVELILEVNPLPSFDLKDNYTFCVDADGSEVTPPPIIDTGLNTADYSFEWYLNGVLIAGAVNSSYIPNQTGTYNVVVTNSTTGCITAIDDPNTIAEVNESARPLLTASQVSLAFVEGNRVLATATPVGPLTNGNAFYEFSLDGGPWVSNTPNNGTYTFENIAAGEHTIRARDISGCGTASVTITVLDYPQYFTPNGDGYHDKWNIIGLEDQSEAKLYIFDRYGKLLKQISPRGIGWDGTFNNELMPTDDYWFKLEYTQPNTGEREEFRANFTLKR